MSLAWHIARKDLFRLRFILLLWAVAITGHLTFATLQSALNPASAALSYIPALIFGYVFLPAFSLGLPMGALHDDSPADSDAFWVTRPISGRRLLTAKAIVLVALALFPVLVTAPWWFASHYDFAQLAAATLNTARWNASLMMLSVAIASMSRSVGRFLMGGFAAALPFLFLATFVYPPIAADHAFSATPLDGTAWTRFMAGSWGIVTILVLLNQFLTRRTARSVGLAVLGATVALIASLYSKMPSPATELPRVADSTPQLRALLSPMVGSVSHHHGLTLRVVEAAMDGSRYVMVVTEAAPDFSLPMWMKAPSPGQVGPFSAPLQGTAPAQPGQRESYFLVHRSDGRFVRGDATVADVRLVAATRRFSQRGMVFSAPADWQRDAAFNFNAWVKDTTLVKFTAPTDLAEPPSNLLPADSSPP